MASTALFATFAALSLGAIGELQRAAEGEATILARTVVRALEGVIRLGADQEGRVQAILEEVSRDPELLSVAIVTSQGEPVVQLGAVPIALPTPLAFEQVTRGEGRLTVSVPFEVRAGCMAPGACACSAGACACHTANEPG